MNDRVKLGVSVGGIAALISSGIVAYQVFTDDAPGAVCRQRDHDHRTSTRATR